MFINKSGDYGYHAIAGALAPNADITSDLDTAQLFHIGYHADNNAWWIQYKDKWLGYIDATYWSPELKGATGAEWYGEVGSSTSQYPCTEMGNGKLGSEPGSAEIRDMFYEVFDAKGKSVARRAAAKILPHDRPPAGIVVWDSKPAENTTGVSQFSYGGPGFCKGVG
jgi:hypothetical protein